MSSPVRNQNLNQGKTLAYCSIFTALALIFSYVEFLLPIPIPLPGVKIGVANLVIILALYRLGFKYAFTVNMVRILISGLLFSGVFGMLYSFAGGILSIVIMYILYRTKIFSMIGISMAGGVAHNIGQLLTASALLSSTALLSYFPILVFTGIISGILTGFLSYEIERRLPSHIKL